VGQKLIGTIISHLPDKDDERKVVGLMVSIVENQVKGLVPNKELTMRQEFIPVFYKVGNEIDVEIISITKKGLRLKLITD
jgi:ribosomal protein S1